MLQHYQLLLRWRSAAVMSSPADDVPDTETEAAAEASWDISYLQRQPEETDTERHLRSKNYYIRESKPKLRYKHCNTLYNNYLLVSACLTQCMPCMYTTWCLAHTQTTVIGSTLPHILHSYLLLQDLSAYLSSECRNHDKPISSLNAGIEFKINMNNVCM